MSKWCQETFLLSLTISHASAYQLTSCGFRGVSGYSGVLTKTVITRPPGVCRRLITSPISSSWYPALFLTRSPTFTYHRPVCCVVSGANLLPSVRETNFNSRRIVGSGTLKDFRDNSNCTRKHPPNACACSVRPTLHKITDFHLSPLSRSPKHCFRSSHLATRL